MTSLLERLLAGLERLCMAVSSAALFLLMALVTVDAVTRYVIRVTLPDVYHFSELYLMPAIVFLALAYTQRFGGHVSVELLDRIVPARVLGAIRRTALFATACIAALAAYAAFPLAWQHLLEWRVTGGEVPWPTGLSQIMVPIGLSLLALRLMVQVLIVKRGS